MSEMVDRVARAQWAAEWDESSVPFDLLSESERNAQIVIARAAMEVMREPTDAMMAAGTAFVYEGWASKESGQKAIAKESWQAMIEEALK